MHYFSKVQGRQFRSVDEKATYDSVQTNNPYVRLVREPSNAFDKNAIKVMVGNTHIGYVEKEIASFLAQDMDRNAKITAQVDHFDTDAKGNRIVYILIKDESGQSDPD